MVDFSSDDWLIGLSTLSIVIFGYVLGLFFFYKSRKLKIKLLSYYCLAITLVTTGWLSIVIDFLSVLITSNSINKILYVYLMWIPTPLSGIIFYFIAAKFLMPNKKWYFLVPITIFYIFQILSTLANPLGSVVFIEPPLTGFIHKAGLNPNTISSLIGLLSILLIMTYTGFGYLYKGFKSKDVIRKKFFYLGVSSLLLFSFGMLDSLTSGIALVIVRIGAMSNFIFAYLGLRKEPERRTKRIKVTDETITFHLERKICVVCKGDVSRVNYMCPKCNTLYCVSCSEALSNLENMCWVCDEIFDDSKPVRPQKAGVEPVKLKLDQEKK